jgi:hypothetical protein
MSTVQVRNDFGETRDVPSLGWEGIEPGGEITVEVENAYHWAAGGWTVLGRYPVPGHLLANHKHDPNAYDPEATITPPPPPPAAPVAAAPATPEESAK